MRAYLISALMFVIPVLGYAASVTELPDWKSTGYRVDFSSDDSGTTVVVGQTFPSSRVSFEEDSAFSGNLYACDTKTFVADTCDLLTALTADVPEFTVRTNRTFYIVVVTTGDASWLKIRGSHEDIIGGSILELDDVDAPDTGFTGLAREVLAVNAGETALEFVPRLGTNETEIYVVSDLPTPSGGEITLTSGLYVFKNDITIADTLVVAPSATVELQAEGFGPIITYTGTGTLLESASGGFINVRRMRFVLSGNGATFVDTTSSSLGLDGIQVTFTGATGSLGTVVGDITGLNLRQSLIAGFTTGLAISGSPSIGMNNVSMVADAAHTGSVIDIAADVDRVAIDSVLLVPAAAEDAFDIASLFVGRIDMNRVDVVQGDFFDATGLDETSKFINVSESGTQKDSKNIGSVMVNDNTAATVIALIDTWVDLNLDAMATVGSNIELWDLDSSTTAQLSYDGVPPFNGTLTASIAGISSGAAQEFQFRVVINGSPVAGSPIAAREFRGETGSVMLIVPVVANPGDTVRIQVQNVGGTSNIVIQFLSAEVSWLFLLAWVPRQYYAEAA